MLITGTNFKTHFHEVSSQIQEELLFQPFLTDQEREAKRRGVTCPGQQGSPDKEAGSLICPRRQFCHVTKPSPRIPIMTIRNNIRSQ